MKNNKERITNPELDGSISDEEEVTYEHSKVHSESPLSINFPWLSLLASLFAIGLLIILSDPELIEFYRIPDVLMTSQTKYTFLVFMMALYIADIRRFTNRKKSLQLQIRKIWESKKKQQQRANTYSGRTDKLKAYISDKLLESIEFDEKFLHFKGIASEVRHNGVISYDKVITAINNAIEQQKFLALYEQQSETPSPHTIDSLAHYQTALDAMRYLWALLDLSTADNMSLHIGNQLIECEEHYFQLHLDSEKRLDSTQSIPISPTFHPLMATMMTLSLISDDSEIRNTISLAKINHSILNEEFEFENEQYRIALQSQSEMLGNPNHIILLLENLIKNAMFFTTKSSYRQQSDRIAIRLTDGHKDDKENNRQLHFSIYNRGPHITEDLDKIFNLGFSTRRNKQHHGKGLGLFFVNEIVKGYQGEILATNIENDSLSYQLSVHTADGESSVSNIESSYIDNRVLVRFADEKNWSKQLKIDTDQNIESIEVRQNDSDVATQRYDELADSELVEWVESNAELRPRWRIDVNQSKRKNIVTFSALDIRGVCFDLYLPTAESSL
jgi:signal transduction histidine kinase